MPRNPESIEDRRGRRCRKASRRRVPQRIDRRRLRVLDSGSAVRVKRRGKSPPLQAQARRHGKPHRVQGQIEDPETARFSSAPRNGFRVLAAETNDSLPGVFAGKTKFGLQPFQNFHPSEGRFPRVPTLIEDAFEDGDSWNWSFRGGIQTYSAA